MTRRTRPKCSRCVASTSTATSRPASHSPRRCIYTPTFVVVDNGHEIGRISGYTNDDVVLGTARQVRRPDSRPRPITPEFLRHATLVTMTSILPSALENELRDGAEYSPELDQLMRKARKASNFLKALSHENRLLLLCLLAERERSVTELENILSLRQSAVSQQLARLRYDGMVDTRRDGKTIYYSLANDDVRRVISVVYDIFCAPVETTVKK